MYTLYFDGLFRDLDGNKYFEHNESVMCYGWVISTSGNDIARGYGSYTHREYASSNGAEYLALIKGMEALRDLGLQNKQVLIIGDAKSIIMQMQGIAGVSSPRVKPLFLKAMRICKKMRGIQWRWVPRNQNKAADQMSRSALRQISKGRRNDYKSKRSSGFQLLYDLMVSHKQGWQVL
jgi:ribonuclease HI